MHGRPVQFCPLGESKEIENRNVAGGFAATNSRSFALVGIRLGSMSSTRRDELTHPSFSPAFVSHPVASRHDDKRIHDDPRLAH
jgi:hypothetical protein